MPWSGLGLWSGLRFALVQDHNFPRTPCRYCFTTNAQARLITSYPISTSLCALQLLKERVDRFRSSILSTVDVEYELGSPFTNNCALDRTLFHSTSVAVCRLYYKAPLLRVGKGWAFFANRHFIQRCFSWIIRSSESPGNYSFVNSFSFSARVGLRKQCSTNPVRRRLDTFTGEILGHLIAKIPQITIQSLMFTLACA